MMITIALLSTSGLSSRQGISTVLFDYFSRIDKSQFKVDYLVDGEYSEELVNEYKTGGIGIQYLPSRKKNTLSFYRELFKIIKKNKYSVFYINGSSAIMGLDLTIAKIAGCKVRIAHSHNTKCDHEKADRLLRPLFNKSYTHAIACGKDAGEWLFSGRSYEILHNGRSVEKYRFNELTRNEMRREFNLKDSTIAIGHVGYFCEQKNQKYLVDVITALKDEDVELFFIGEGETLDEVRRYASEQQMEDRIHFTGALPNVSDYLQMMDAMALPSLFEGLPLVAVEWQIAGLPCLISDKVTEECACTDLVRFASIKDEPEIWGRKIVEMAKTNREARLGRNQEICQRVIESGFDIDENIKSLERLLKQYMYQEG